MDADADALPSGVYAGRAAFRRLVEVALAAAARQRWPTLMFCDPDYADWPLGETRVIKSLHQWARHASGLTMVARSYRAVWQRHPRFVEWRRLWGHKIECRVCATLTSTTMPSGLCSSAWLLARVGDGQHFRGVSGTDPERLSAWRQQADECWRRGTPGFPATTLGL